MKICFISAGHFEMSKTWTPTRESARSRLPGGRVGVARNLQQAFVAAKREHTQLYPVLAMPVIALPESTQTCGFRK